MTVVVFLPYTTLVRVCLISLLSQTLCDPMDCSPPGSSVNGILQARILEWVGISFSRGSPDLGTEPTSLASPVLQADSLLMSHQGCSYYT